MSMAVNFAYKHQQYMHNSAISTHPFVPSAMTYFGYKQQSCSYSASPHPSSMQHHNELQTAVCGPIVLDHLLSLRVIKKAGGRRAN